MAIYYSDNPLLSLATAMYTDASLTTKAADAYYSDGTIYRRQVGGMLQAAVTACDNCSQNPLTSVLTFTQYQGGNYPNSKFTFTLSNKIPLNDIIIDSPGITTYSNTCTTPIENDTLFDAITLLKGTYTVSGKGEGIACSSIPGSKKYKKASYLTVNGVQKFHGETIDIGGTLVTININSTLCNSLNCLP